MTKPMKNTARFLLVIFSLWLTLAAMTDVIAVPFHSWLLVGKAGFDITLAWMGMSLFDNWRLK